MVLDNRLPAKDHTSIYKHPAMAMTNMFAMYLLNEAIKKGVDVRQFTLAIWNLKWQDDTNIHDCGIYVIRHMEAFQGGSATYWTTGFEKNKEKFVRHLRSRYAAMILESELNGLQVQVQEAAKKEFQHKQVALQDLQQ